MAYSADTFVADEQPTTAKWNKLWTNDASFNDGTGIGDDTIDSRHYVTNSIDGEHLATNAIKLGVTKGTSTVTHTTVETTIASVAVTVPAGGRDVLLMVTYPQLYSTVSSDRAQLKIKESSTVFELYYHGLASSSLAGAVTLFATVSAPSAGAHTYIVTGQRDIGSGTVTYYADGSGANITLLALLI
jgi:hypothetical protein